jgi:TIGR03009 family protein
MPTQSRGHGSRCNSPIKVSAMRTLLISLLFTVASFAQADPKPVNKADKILDETLTAWEKRMSKLEGLSATCKVTELEDGEKAVFTGEVSFMRPHYAKLFLKPQADPDNKRKWRNLISDGTDFWELNHHTKTAVANPLLKGAHSGPVSLVTGTNTNEVRDRYELSVATDDPKQFNDFYVHLTIKPKTKADMQDFKKAELVLWRSQNPKFAANYMLPARLWFQRPNSSQVTWEFTDLEEKKFAKEDFALPKLSADWTIERANAMSRPK